MREHSWDGSRARRLQVADDESDSWRERRAHAYDLFRSERISAVRGHQSVPFENSSRPLAGDPESTEDQADWDGQESRWMLEFPHLCASALSVLSVNCCESTSRGLTLQVVCTSARIDLDVGAGDQGTRLGYASGGTGKIELALEAAGKTTILFELKLGEVVTTNATIVFNLQTVECKNHILTVWTIGGLDKSRRQK